MKGRYSRAAGRVDLRHFGRGGVARSPFSRAVPGLGIHPGGVFARLALVAALEEERLDGFAARQLRLDLAPEGPDRVLSEGRDQDLIDAREGRDHLRGGADELPLEKRGLADDLLRPLLVVDARELHDQPLRSNLLDERLLDTEFVDAIANDRLRPVDRVRPCLGRHRALGVIHLERQVHPALQIEAQLHRAPRLDLVLIEVEAAARHEEEDQDDTGAK